MQYLGEFLSPQNSISLDQDKLTKYFYFRPDQYDDPDSDLENIFIIRSMVEFPKRYDKLAENDLYAIDNIEVSKRISDEEVGVKKVSYVVTATYDLLENIKKREATEEAEEEEPTTIIRIDTDGNKVTGDTPPWKLRPEYSFQPVEVTVPFIKAYDPITWQQTVDVVNYANTRIIAETKRYQLEITYTKNYEFTRNDWDNLLECYTNSAEFDILFDKRTAFPSGTLLILPPTCQTAFWEETKKDDSKQIHQYYTYTIKMIYDPNGWKKNLLNIGTFALFPNGNGLPEQIFRVTVTDQNGILLPGYPQWTSRSKALEIKAQNSQNGNLFSADAETNPLPLTASGTIDINAMTNPVKNPYVTKTFVQYKEKDFNTLPW